MNLLEWFTNDSFPTFLVNMSASFSSERIKIISTVPFWTCSRIQWYFMSMCFVRALDFALWLRNIAPTLSQYILIGCSMSISRNVNIILIWFHYRSRILLHILLRLKRELHFSELFISRQPNNPWNKYSILLHFFDHSCLRPNHCRWNLSMSVFYQFASPP